MSPIPIPNLPRVLVTPAPAMHLIRWVQKSTGRIVDYTTASEFPVSQMDTDTFQVLIAKIPGHTLEDATARLKDLTRAVLPEAFEMMQRKGRWW